MAQHEWENGSPSLLDTEVLLSERWAVFSRYPSSHKIICNLDEDFYMSMGYTALASHINDRLNISSAKLNRTNLGALSTYLSSLKPPIRASTAKLINNWIPTHSVLYQRGRAPSSLCLRCNSFVETSEHIMSCPNIKVPSSRKSSLDSFLSRMRQAGSPNYILSTFKYKLSLTLHCDYNQHISCMSNFLRPLTPC